MSIFAICISFICVVFRLAIGFGNGTIRTWDLSRPHLQYVSMIEYNLKFRGRISRLAFSPSKENCLAYGTCDGQVNYKFKQ